jgi:hypothetical protein
MRYHDNSTMAESIPMTLATRHPKSALDRGVSLQGGWDKFRLIQRGCDETPGVRLFYFDGETEILMPGQLHEIFAHALGVFLTNFLAYQGVVFFGMGTVDQEREGIASAQPDLSYCIRPELEVIPAETLRVS